MEKVYRFSEIFQSIQGEGIHKGMPAIFLRFTGCNMDCWFCDTKEKLNQTNFKFTLDNLVKYLNTNFKCKNLILTGGEPFLQISAFFVRRLFDFGFKIFIETNGTISIEKVDEEIFTMAWITVSPKNLQKWKLKKGNELKIVVTEFIEMKTLKYFKERGKFDYYFLQPQDNQKSQITRILNYIENHSEEGWRLSLQEQKILNIR